MSAWLDKVILIALMTAIVTGFYIIVAMGIVR